MTIKPLNILLADDNLDDHFFFERALKELKISVNLKTVRDGEELMNYLYRSSEQLPDIIFLDLNMNCKNGFECLVEIKETENLKDISIVILSTSIPQDKNYELGMISNLFKLGASVFICKPNEPGQLKQAISHALSMVKEDTGLKYIINA